MSTEKKATAPKSGEPKPDSSPTAVASAHTDAECADGMPPIPVNRVKSTRRAIKRAALNLNSCAVKSARSASTSGGFQSMIDLKVLPVALHREPSQCLQFRCVHASCIECCQRIVHFVERAHARWPKTHHRRKCGLGQRTILPCFFPELSEAARFIQHVIRDLKREPHASTVRAERA